MEQGESVGVERVSSKPECREDQVVSTQVPVEQGDIRKMTTRGGRDSMDGSAPIGRGHGTQGARVGADRSGCLCSGYGVGEDEVVLVVGCVIHDRGEGRGRGQRKMTVETGECEITLVLEWGKTEFHVKEPNGSGGDSENPS